jgi:large subunit ribosomal protein L22
MKAFLQSARIAPKKANLIARMVRGMPVPMAVEALRRTNKKGARMVEKLLLSAIANASHNDKQDPQTMIVKTVVVNQGQALRRGMPKARGQMRPFRKFLSHIEVTLGYPEVKEPKQKAEKKDAEKTSQTSENTVKKAKKAVKKNTDTSSTSQS